jgi:hypothetical protein
MKDYVFKAILKISKNIANAASGSGERRPQGSKSSPEGGN